MLDTQLLEQLKTLFAQLENPVKLVYEPSSHADQDELVSLLTAVASTSSKLSVELIAADDGSQARSPSFTLNTKVSIRGFLLRGFPMDMSLVRLF